MNRKHTMGLISALLVAGLLSSCISFSTLQSVETLDPGEVSVSAGLSILGAEDDNVGALPEVGMRIGLTDRIDVGAKLFLSLAVFVDGKVELIQKPLTVSLDMGYSTFTLKSGDGDTKNRTDGFYPMLMVGQKHWYAAVKPMFIRSTGELGIFGTTSNYTVPSLMGTDLVVGAVLGKRFRLIPEVNFLFSPDWTETVIIPGLGVELHF